MKRIAPLLLLLATPMMAAVVSNVSCRIYAQPTVTAEFACSLGDPLIFIDGPGFAAASTATIGDFGVTADAEAALGNSPNIPFLTSDSSATISRSETVLTSGQEREGFALINWMFGVNCMLSSADAFCSGSMTFGEHSVSSSKFLTTCSFGGCPFGQPILLPVMLGRSIEIMTSVSAFAASDIGQRYSSPGVQSMNLSFSLFEQDGRTPVAWSLLAEAPVSDVPEPATWLMLTLGLGVILWANREAERRS